MDINKINYNLQFALNNSIITSKFLDTFSNIICNDKVKFTSTYLENNIDLVNTLLNSYIENIKDSLYKRYENPYKALIEFKHCKEKNIFSPSEAKTNVIFSIDWTVSNPQDVGPILSLLDKEKLNKEISEICKNDKDIGELSIQDFNCRTDKFCKIIDKYNKVNFEIGDPDRENPI